MFELSTYVGQHYRSAHEQAEKACNDVLAQVLPLDEPVQHFDGVEAIDKLNRALKAVELALSDICRKHTRSYWLMLLRRLHVADTYDGEFPQTGVNIQTTAELAVMKHGLTGYHDLFPGDVPTLADEVSITEGDTPEIVYNKLKSRTISPPVTVEDFYDLVAIHHFSTRFYALTATYRRVGKGSTLAVRNKTEWDATASEDLERLIARYDARLEASEGNLLAALGVSYIMNTDTSLPNMDHPMAFCLVGLRPRCSAEPGTLTPVLRDHSVLIPENEIRYIPAFIDLRRVEQAISFSKGDFERLHEMPWEVWASFMTANAWHILGELSESTTRAFKMATFIRRGCMLTADTTIDNMFTVGAKLVHRKFYPNQQISDHDWDRYRAKFLRLASADPEATNLHSLRPSPFLWSEGTGYMVDYARVTSFVLECLRLRISENVRDAKAAIAEEVFEQDLANRTGLKPHFPRNKKFKDGSRVLGEADLSFRVGSVYVPVDVKAYLVTVEFDRGDYGAVQTRWSYLKKWVDQAEKLALNLKDNPRGSNYDLLAEGITHVLPLVCSPFHEYIGDTHQRYWLSAETPRVAMPAEIAAFLKNYTEDELKSHHCAVALV